MGVIIIGILVFVVFINPFARYFVLHPVKCFKNGAIDLYNHFAHKVKNVCPYYGQIYMFVAEGTKAFGSGKTLSMVEFIRFVYNTYNGLQVWDDETNSFVIQHIIIVSNVQLMDIPYIPFIGKDQFINIDKIPHEKQDVILFCIDEAGSEFNSRQYKDNLPTDFLVRLLQIRHNRCGFLMTSQRFTFTDKLLRNVTGVVMTCRKMWRIVRLQYFDGYTLENCSNPELVRPFKTRFYFADDKLFSAYDTLYNVEKLKNQLSDGDLLDTEEILARIKQDDNLQIVKPRIKRKYKNL